jgi:hypothetical protein
LINGFEADLVTGVTWDKKSCHGHLLFMHLLFHLSSAFIITIHPGHAPSPRYLAFAFAFLCCSFCPSSFLIDPSYDTLA